MKIKIAEIAEIKTKFTQITGTKFKFRNMKNPFSNSSFSTMPPSSLKNFSHFLQPENSP
jgi:hypothetical protein